MPKCISKNISTCLNRQKNAREKLRLFFVHQLVIDSIILIVFHECKEQNSVATNSPLHTLHFDSLFDSMISK